MSVLRTASTATLGLRAPAMAAPSLRRCASTSTATSTADPSASTSSSSTTAAALPMSWAEYLNMRKRRKQWSTLTSVPTTIGGFFAAASYFGNNSIDTDFLGLDPMVIAGGSCVGAMLFGYLVGPSIGNGLFTVTHPKLARGNPPPIDVMDREFYSRVKDKRADPKFQSVNNPAPDFYGEKIVSLPTYRRWLKDQKAYERKASHGVEEDM